MRSSLVFNNIPMSELQNVIDSLPKYVDRYISINCLAGTNNSIINIFNFYGPGAITISGVNRGIISTQNNVAGFNINTCGTIISIDGFNINNNINPGVQINRCTDQVWIKWCRLDSTPVRTQNGFLSSFSPLIFIDFVEINNQYFAIASDYSRIMCNDIRGSGNQYGYWTTSGGILNRMTNGSMTAIILTTSQFGSLLINQSGEILGT